MPNLKDPKNGFIDSVLVYVTSISGGKPRRIFGPVTKIHWGVWKSGDKGFLHQDDFEILKEYGFRRLEKPVNRFENGMEKRLLSIPHIGDVVSSKLKANGITTVEDLAVLTQDELSEMLIGLRISKGKVESFIKAAKSILGSDDDSD